MREWMFVVAPVALVVYFLVYPDQFYGVMDWAARLVH